MVVSTEPQGFTAEDHAIFEKLNIGTEGGRPLPSFIKPSDVVDFARPLAESIFEDWQALKSLVGPNEGRLHEKWKGMKKKNKRELLSEAWGSELPESSQPHLALWKESKGHEEVSERWSETEREAFMWPNINLEDLYKTRPLWLMMKARSRASPDTFAATDLESTTLGQKCQALQPRYLNRYSMAFAGRTSPETYGQLYSWDESASDDEWIRSQMIHPGEGMFILIIQSRLYSFLRNVSIKILGPSPEGDATPSATTTAELDDSFEVPEADFVDLPGSISESAYSRPAVMSLQRLLDYTYAKWREYDDRLWALRNDPTHFAATLRSWKDHRREVVPDSSGNVCLSLQDQEMLWPRVVRAVVGGVMEQFGIWLIIYGKVQLVVQQTKKHGAAVKPDAPLPRDLALTLYGLLQHLQHWEEASVASLTVGAFASPPLRRYFHSLVGKDEQDRTTISLEASSKPPDKETADIIWTLTQLEDTTERQTVGRLALSHLERTLHLHPSSQECISPWVASQLSSWAVVTSLLMEIDRYQPWARSFASEMSDEDTAETLTDGMKRTRQLLNPLLEFDIDPRIADLANPDDGRFDTPEPSQHQTRAQTPEAALEAFWTQMKPSLAPLPYVGTALEQPIPAQANTGSMGDVTVTPIRVSKRCLRVFHAVFYDDTAIASRKSSPPVITWSDFVHAMHAGAKFTVTKLYLSSWLFVPPASMNGRSGYRPILFEEPWGQSKVPALTARWIGRRLWRSYKWGMESFELER